MTIQDAMKRRLFQNPNPNVQSAQVRTRVISRLLREYRRGALSAEEYEAEMRALGDYLPEPINAERTGGVDEGADEDEEGDFDGDCE